MINNSISTEVVIGNECRGAACCASTVAEPVPLINGRWKKLSIVNSQLSIGPASFWWVLSVGTKWSGRSVAVWAQRVCGAHSETQWRSSSADAALIFWYFCIKAKVRIRSWPFGTFGSSQKYECSIEIKIKHLYPYETIEKLYVKRIYP